MEVNKNQIRNITDLKQVSKHGAHLRQISKQFQQYNTIKTQKDITNCENLALNMDLELHEKEIVVQKIPVQPIQQNLQQIEEVYSQHNTTTQQTDGNTSVYLDTKIYHDTEEAGADTH